ncbi:MAG: RNA-binding protein [Candidatus Cloacimonetes bacterium]|nr:RNA-binding protein [Candidatus Cloacimonadota bacterium]
MNIYVGNLAYQMTDETLRTSFEGHGEVTSARIITDRDTGRSRGFGFVEMPNREEGLAAIEALNGSEVDDRTLTVNEARPRPQRDNRGFGNRDSGGGGGGGWNR